MTTKTNLTASATYLDKLDDKWWCQCDCRSDCMVELVEWVYRSAEYSVEWVGLACKSVDYLVGLVCMLAECLIELGSLDVVSVDLWLIKNEIVNNEKKIITKSVQIFRKIRIFCSKFVRNTLIVGFSLIYLGMGVVLCLCCCNPDDSFHLDCTGYHWDCYCVDKMVELDESEARRWCSEILKTIHFQFYVKLNSINLIQNPSQVISFNYYSVQGKCVHLKTVISAKILERGLILSKCHYFGLESLFTIYSW